jgi:hypothetical protein
LLAILVSVSSLRAGAQVPDRNPSGPICIALDRVAGQAVVTSAGQPFATYEFRQHAKPILYPLFGPHGIPITRNYPMQTGVAGEPADHPHHKSVWFAHGDVNGLDFWSEKSRIENRSVDVLVEGGWPGFTAHNQWMDDKRPLIDERTTVCFADEGTVRIIDFEFRLTAVVDVRLGDTKEGTFAIRTHPHLQLKREQGAQPVGRAENSAGQRDGEIWGQRAEWVCYYGEIDGRDIGIAVFEHPSSFRHPTTWHARDYGLVAANPFGWHDFLQMPAGSGDWNLGAGEELRLRYRLLMFAAPFDREQIKDFYSVYSQRQFDSP